MTPFIVRKLERWWCVVEQRAGRRGKREETSLVLVSHHETRELARDAAGQLNQEERRAQRGQSR